MVERVCGIPPELFGRICDLFVENSGRERTAAFVHGVGWTHKDRPPVHPLCVDLQLLLGNMGRPGGGVMAMRGSRVDPGLQRHPDAVRHAARLHPGTPCPRAPRSGRVHRGQRGAPGLLGQYARLHGQPAEGAAGGPRPPTTTSRSRPAAADGQSRDLRHGDGADCGTVEGYFRRVEPGGGIGELTDATTRDVQAQMVGRPRLLG